jgi:hypothetical protein
MQATNLASVHRSEWVLLGTSLLALVASFLGVAFTSPM